MECTVGMLHNYFIFTMCMIIMVFVMMSLIEITEPEEKQHIPSKCCKPKMILQPSTLKYLGVPLKVN
jgi:hypothetical protein